MFHTDVSIVIVTEVDVINKKLEISQSSQLCIGVMTSGMTTSTLASGDKFRGEKGEGECNLGTGSGPASVPAVESPVHEITEG